MSDKIGVQCPGCGHKFRAPAAAVGRKGRCTKCAHVFIIEEMAAEAGALADAVEYIGLDCPCGKVMRVRAEYAGMQVKCTACGQALIVPGGEPEPEVAIRAPTRASGGRSVPWLWISVAGAAAVVLVVVGVVMMGGKGKQATASTAGSRGGQASHRTETPKDDSSTSSRNEADDASEKAAGGDAKEQQPGEIPNLKQRQEYLTGLGEAFHKYAQAHNDAYPPDLKTLVDEHYVEAVMLKAPGDKSDNEISYEYVAGVRLDGDQGDVVAYEKANAYSGDKVCVLYADSHVESRTHAKLQAEVTATQNRVLARAKKGTDAKLADASVKKNTPAPAPAKNKAKDKDEDKPDTTQAKGPDANADDKPSTEAGKAVTPQELAKRKAEVDALESKMADAITASIEAGKLKEAKAGIEEIAGKLAAYVERTSTPQWHASVAPAYQLLERKRAEYNKKLKAANGDEREVLDTTPKIPPDALKALNAGRKALQGIAAKLAKKDGMEAARLLQEGQEALDKALSITSIPPWHETIAPVYQLLEQHKAGLKTELAMLKQSKDSIDEDGLKVGAYAPPFEAKTLEGKPLSSKSFAGKWMLIDFWATWCGPCRGEVPHLKAVYEEFGKDPHFVMMSLTIDDSMLPPKQYVKENQLNWVQGYLGIGWNAPLLKLFGIHSIPAIYLISPEGKVVARGLRGDGIKQAVAKALKEGPTS